jgi:hypothetical protein
MRLFEEMKLDYDLCINDPISYKQKIDSISDLLRLKNYDRLIDDTPVYLVGKYEKSPFVLFGINPGYSSKNNPTEDREARISWENYLNLYKNFFLYFENMKFESPYYNSLWYLLTGLLYKEKYLIENKWKLFDSYLINIELIPYHSRGITMPRNLTPAQYSYLNDRFKNSIEFVTQFNPKLFIFNGNPWYILLIYNNLINKYEKVQLSRKFSIYFFTINDIPCVLFDKFFQRHFWGINNEHRNKTIPNLIHNKYPNLLKEINNLN